jgi:phosphate transport system substrate-binding protein
LRIPSIAWLASLALVGCDSGSAGGHVTVAGSTAFAPVVEKLAAAFKAKRPGSKVEVHAVGSMVGLKNLADGACDVAMADLPDIPPEAAGFKAVTLSMDGISVVVHPKNAVTGLTLDQVSKIFDGTITNWKEVGGADVAITVVCREENSGSRKTFDTIAKIKGRVTKKAQFLNSNGACRSAVASDPNAISYVTMVQVDASVRPLSIGGVESKIENVKSGAYPIVALDYFMTKGDPAGLSKEFIDFALSAEGQKIISDAGLIPVK